MSEQRSEEHQPWPSDCAVLVPVYNHAGTVAQVVSDLRALGAEVLCIDDGSSDGSGQQAAEAGAELISCPVNRGKGAALQRGFDLLGQRGWSAVCTVDADGQHPAQAALELAQAARADAQAIWVGLREMPEQTPFLSRFGRSFSNFWVRVACSVWPGDAQCGLRVYPLPSISQIPCRARRYSFEVEVLVRAVWAGLTIRCQSVAVRYPEERISHFHKLRDNLRTAWTFTRLVTRAFIPWPHRHLRPRSWSLRGFLTLNASPGGLALAAGLGAAIGVSPFVGLQTLILVWLCCVLRVNFPTAFLASNISLGPLMAVWAALSISLGNSLRVGIYQPLTLYEQLRDQLLLAENSIEYWDVIRPLLHDWFLGSLLVMPATGLLIGVLVWIWARLCWPAQRLSQ